MLSGSRFIQPIANIQAGVAIQPIAISRAGIGTLNVEYDHWSNGGLTMTAQTVMHNGDGWDEEQNEDVTMDNPLVTKKRNFVRPPPIDITRCSSNRTVFPDDGDAEDGDIVAASTYSATNNNNDNSVSKENQASPASPPSVTSSPISSPASAASTDTADGGILRRKSSIKATTKTPETPGRKSVRFADVLGLDLETVRDILQSESPPDYPSMALAACSTMDDSGGSSITLLQPRYLTMSSVQPGGQPDFLIRVYDQKVCLENVVVSDFTVLGTVKVRNLAYRKRVKIRYSADGWKTFGDVPASYVLNSCDGPTDRFSFGLTAPRQIAVGDPLEFCISYTAAGQDYWDNNFGQNYSLMCHSQGEIIDAENKVLWTHFL